MYKNNKDKYKKNSFYKNKKSITPIITGITITFIAVLFMVVIINFAIPYFNTLQDLTQLKNNKQSLLVIDEIFNELSIAEVGSIKTINIHPNNIIIFDSENRKLIIKQEIKSTNFYNKIKDNLNYGNLNIKRNNDNLIYTLQITPKISIFENIEIMPSNQKIQFEIIGLDNNNKPIIKISRVNNNYL